MRDVTYSLSASLDGYIADSTGSFDWSAPDQELFTFATDEVRDLGVHLMGRRLYETMLYWETADQDPALHENGQDSVEVESLLAFASVWTSLPKVVFSTTLTSVQGRNTRLADGGLAEEIARWRAEPGVGNIGIGGASLAAEAAALDLIDEYRVRVCPVLVGGGRSYFPQHDRRVDLELLESRSFASQVSFLRYRVRH